jgi:hypothetical protein
MIFVILGISVLVASFLIALVSLIREQSKLIDEVKRDEVESDHATSGPKARKKAVSGQVGLGAGEVLNKHVAVYGAKPAINRPLFPWEEGKYQAAGNISDSDREKVEILRVQLAELKSRVATKSSNEDKAEVFVAKPKEDKMQQKLSGEISIADLKGQ